MGMGHDDDEDEGDMFNLCVQFILVVMLTASYYKAANDKVLAAVFMRNSAVTTDSRSRTRD